MEHRRIAPMMQIPTYEQYLVNGVSFQTLAPPFASDGAFLSPYGKETTGFDDLYPPIDADQSLLTAFSSLNLAPAAYTDRLPSCVPAHGGQIGSSSGAGEGFAHPLNSPRVMRSDLGVNDYFDRQIRFDNMEALRRDCFSRFDSGFDFDHKSRLGSKKSPNLTHLSDDNKLKFQRSDYHEQLNPCCSSNHLFGAALTKNQSQNQNHEFISPWSLKKLRGRIYTMAKDQNGCKVLEAMFETPTVEEVEFVLSEVVNFISDLMKDQFGNLLVEKLVVRCNDDQKMQLILSLIKDIILVCMNPHGTRSVQKLLENLHDPNQVKLVMKALHHGATTLATDSNGHHVIQYCLVNFHTHMNMPILSEIANKCYTIATDRSGCCVLQACVEHARGEARTRIIAEILNNSLHLAEDPFGNYVLQHMVGLNIPELTALLVRQLQGNFASLSCNKYGSNVVEKCLNESGEAVSSLIVLELIRSPNSPLLLVDPYANFVIQSALKVSKGFAHECLRGLISKNMLSMQTNLYGKKILGRFNKKANFV